MGVPPGYSYEGVFFQSVLFGVIFIAILVIEYYQVTRLMALRPFLRYRERQLYRSENNLPATAKVHPEQQEQSKAPAYDIVPTTVVGRLHVIGEALASVLFIPLLT
jgi:hypothetical protein